MCVVCGVFEISLERAQGGCNGEGYMVGSPCSHKNELSWPIPCERASKTDLVSLFDFVPGTSP